MIAVSVCVLVHNFVCLADHVLLDSDALPTHALARTADEVQERAEVGSLCLDDSTKGDKTKDYKENEEEVEESIGRAWVEISESDGCKGNEGEVDGIEVVPLFLV